MALLRIPLGRLLLPLLSTAFFLPLVSGLGEPAPLTFDGPFCSNGPLVNMTCPTKDNYVIRVVSAFFGNNASNSNCNSETNCEFKDVTSILSSQCDRKTSCSYNVTEQLFGEHCVGTQKQLNVRYQCFLALQRVRQCPDEPRLRLTCPTGKVLRVVDAFWGQSASSDVCSLGDDSSRTDCVHPGAGQRVEQFCQNKGNCSLCANGLPGVPDQCPDTRKYLEVSYVCGECMNVHNDEQCEEWASPESNQCVENPDWMIANCRKSCWKCDSSKTCTDANEDCTCSAMRGDCESDTNSAVRNQCRQSCQNCERGGGTGTATPTTCVDSDTRCRGWATDGECDNNRDWMSANCRKSCKICEEVAKGPEVPDTSCVDSNVGCPGWANDGECERNRGWMSVNCRKSCGTCDEAVCVNTYGNDTACDGWVSEGYCSISRTWMSQNCQRSCGLCNQLTATLPKPHPPRYSPCINKLGDDTKCRIYVVRGECEGNPGWMLENCQKSCGACPYRSGLIPTDSPCVNSYGNDTTCEDFSRRGECITNPNWMVPNCGASCGACVSTADVTSRVFFDITIGGEPVGRIVFGLFENIAPLTAGNFKKLAVGFVDDDGEKLWYKGSPFHRVIKDFMIQGGDIVAGNGLGFKSTFGGHFPDENFILRNFGPGWLGMANRGPDTNGCQIYITTSNTPWLNGKHVVFGKVLQGMSVVRAIEKNPTDDNDKPIKAAVVADSGTLPVVRPFSVTRAPIWEN